MSSISFDLAVMDEIIEKNNCDFGKQKEIRARFQKIDEIIVEQGDLLKNRQDYDISEFYGDEKNKKNLVNIHQQYSYQQLSPTDWLDKVWNHLETRNKCNFSKQRNDMRVTCSSARRLSCGDTRLETKNQILATENYEIFDSLTDFGFAQNYDFILSQLKFLEEKQSSMPHLNRKPLSAQSSNHSKKSKNNPRNHWETQSLSSFNTEIKVNNWLVEKTSTFSKNSFKNNNNSLEKKRTQSKKSSHTNKESKLSNNPSDFYSSTYFTSGDLTNTENESLFHDLDYATDAVQEVIEIAAIDQHIDDNYENLIEYNWKNPAHFCSEKIEKSETAEKEIFLIEKARSDFSEFQNRALCKNRARRSRSRKASTNQTNTNSSEESLPKSTVVPQRKPINNKTSREISVRRKSAGQILSSTQKNPDKATITYYPLKGIRKIRYHSEIDISKNSLSKNKNKHCGFSEQPAYYKSLPVSSDNESCRFSKHTIPEYDKIFEEQWREICVKNNLMKPSDLSLPVSIL